MVENNALFIAFTITSYTLPKCGANGGLKIHSMPLAFGLNLNPVASWTFSQSTAWIHSRKSLSAFLKDVWLSEVIVLGTSLTSANLEMASKTCIASMPPVDQDGLLWLPCKWRLRQDLLSWLSSSNFQLKWSSKIHAHVTERPQGFSQSSFWQCCLFLVECFSPCTLTDCTQSLR